MGLCREETLNWEILEMDSKRLVTFHLLILKIDSIFGFALLDVSPVLAGSQFHVYSISISTCTELYHLQGALWAPEVAWEPQSEPSLAFVIVLWNMLSFSVTLFQFWLFDPCLCSC